MREDVLSDVAVRVVQLLAAFCSGYCRLPMGRLLSTDCLIWRPNLPSAIAAHASAATAALSLIPALFSGGDGTRWFPREVQQVLADATQALAAAKAWLPKASFQSLQILLTQHK